MESQFLFTNLRAILSLKDICISNVVTKLWNDPEILRKIRNITTIFQCPEKLENALEQKMLQKLYQLALPKTLEREVSDMIRPIIIEVKAWYIQEYYSRVYDENNLFQEMGIDFLQWFDNGTINRAETLHMRITHYKLYDIDTYYEACNYCSEIDIQGIWAKTETLLRNENMLSHYKCHLGYYWDCVFRKRLSRCMQELMQNDKYQVYNSDLAILPNMLTLSVIKGFDTATKYFWNRLTEDEKRNDILRWIEYALTNTERYLPSYMSTSTHMNIFCFLISQEMAIEYYPVLLENHCGKILLAFFTIWPWQKCLLPTFKIALDYMDEMTYSDFLVKIIIKIGREKSVGKIFNKIWCNSSLDLRNSFVDKISDKAFPKVNYAFNKLISSLQDFTTVNLLLNDVPSSRKSDIITSLERHTVITLVRNHRIHLLDTFLKENNISECKAKFAAKYEIIIECRLDLEEVQMFLDWCFSSTAQKKAFMVEAFNATETLTSLIYDFKLANEFIVWYSSFNENFKNEFKSFVKENFKSIVLKFCTRHCIEKFIDWCFDSESEIHQFKTHLLEYKVLEDIMTQLMRDGTTDIFKLKSNLHFSQSTLDWCFDEVLDDIKEFKEKLFISDGVTTILKELSLYFMWELNDGSILSTLISWFSCQNKELVHQIFHGINEKLQSEFSHSYYLVKNYKMLVDIIYQTEHN